MRARDESLPGMRASTPVIIYHITYDDGEKVPPNPIALASALTLTLTHPSMPFLDLSSTVYAHAPPLSPQVAEDLRTLPVRMVHEETPEEDAVQCFQQ